MLDIGTGYLVSMFILSDYPFKITGTTLNKGIIYYYLVHVHDIRSKYIFVPSVLHQHTSSYKLSYRFTGTSTSNLSLS